jgi:phage head maturation protease
MLKATGVLSTSESVKGIIVNPRGVEVPDHVPVLDSHDVRNGCLGYLEKTWVEAFDDDPALMGDLVFTGRAGRRAYEMIERGSLNGVSCSFQIENVAIFDADGDELSAEEAVERGPDDPDLIVIAQRTILREISVTAMPADAGAFVRACSLEAVAWQMIRDGEETLHRILRQDRHGIGDVGNMWQRIMADRKLVHYGAPESIE